MFKIGKPRMPARVLEMQDSLTGCAKSGINIKKLKIADLKRRGVSRLASSVAQGRIASKDQG